MKRDDDGRPPSPGDDIDAMVADLASGDDSMFVDDDSDWRTNGPGDQAAVSEPPAGETKVLITPTPDEATRPGPISLTPPDPILHEISGHLRTCLKDPILKGEVNAFASFLAQRDKDDLALVFHTPIGNVSSPIVWCNIRPKDWLELDELILVMVRTTSASFSPEPDVEMELSLRNRDQETTGRKVLCLSKPLSMYPGAGIDLLCFVPYNDDVEKNGQLQEDAPSVVSGDPSDAIDEAGEPIVEGEKSAAVKDIPLTPAVPTEDFDKARSS